MAIVNWRCPDDWKQWSEFLAAPLHARNRWRLPVLLLGMGRVGLALAGHAVRPAKDAAHDPQEARLDSSAPSWNWSRAVGGMAGETGAKWREKRSGWWSMGGLYQVAVFAARHGCGVRSSWAGPPQRRRSCAICRRCCGRVSDCGAAAGRESTVPTASVWPQAPDRNARLGQTVTDASLSQQNGDQVLQNLPGDLSPGGAA